MNPLLQIPDEVRALVQAGAPVAYGVSGGKDGEAAALELDAYLDSIGHPRAKRVVIHADLGEIEWTESLPQARRLAERLGLRFVVVRRPAGGMLERWEQRWASSVRRYTLLECVTLIPPWSSAAMRFCTSELKSAPISAELKRLFPGERIVSVSGIRAEESAKRRQLPIVKPDPRLTAKRAGTSGVSYHPIHAYTRDEVYRVHEAHEFPLHEAYTRFRASRVSCSMCILSTERDQRAALDDERNHPAYHRIVALEARSAFSFQPSRWAGDLRPDLFTAERRAALATAKDVAACRAGIEARIPEDLLYDGKGWPKRLPTSAEAELLAGVRQEVGALQAIECQYVTADAVLGRYAELIAERQRREAA